MSNQIITLGFLKNLINGAIEQTQEQLEAYAAKGDGYIPTYQEITSSTYFTYYDESVNNGYGLTCGESYYYKPNESIHDVSFVTKFPMNVWRWNGTTEDGGQYNTTLYDGTWQDYIYDNDVDSVIRTHDSGVECSLTSAETSSTMCNMMFNGNTNLTSLDISQFDTSQATSMFLMFAYCEKLDSLDLSTFDTRNVTNMNIMFGMCSSLTSLNLSNFDTSNVTDMYLMFGYCQSLTSLDLSSWDTSKVTDMYAMFYGCTSLTSLDVSNWNTSNVTDMTIMFNGSKLLTELDLSSFDTSNVTNMSEMFDGCESLTSLDLSSFDTSKVTDMGYMFNGCSSLRYITLSSNFFKTTKAIPFNGASNLGLNTDNSDNGWLAHLVDIAPQITDGQSRTIQLHNNLKNKSWASTHITTLQNKGYTIS